MTRGATSAEMKLVAPPRQLARLLGEPSSHDHLRTQRAHRFGKQS